MLAWTLDGVDVTKTMTYEEVSDGNILSGVTCSKGGAIVKGDAIKFTSLRLQAAQLKLLK